MEEFMEIENNIISMDTYKYYISSKKELKDVLEKIKGKKIVDENRTIEDCGVNFIKNLLGCDWGRSIVVTYSDAQMDFIKSKYLSNYFKENIKELLNGLMSDEVRNLLDSDKDINQMDEKEIKLLNDTIDEYYNNGGKTKKPNISGYFLTYLYKLDGNGVTSFIKNNIDGESIARHILLTSGLNDRASYYSGRGVMSCDLNTDHLCEIFIKLFRLDSEYAFNFVNMVYDMKTLGATEFINSFIRLGINKFKYQKRNKEDSNISFDGVEDEARFGVAFGTIMSSMYGKDEDYQIEASKQMKLSFLYKIRNTFVSIKNELIQTKIDEILNKDLDWNEYYGWGPYGRYYKRR